MPKQKQPNKKGSDAHDGGFDVGAHLLKMQENLNDARWLAKTCRVLEENFDSYCANLSADDGMRMIKQVIQGLQKHPSNQRDFHVSACKLLSRFLPREESNEECLLDVSAIEAVVHVLENNKHNADVQETALSMLKFACDGMDLPRSTVEALSQAAFGAMRRHKEHLRVDAEAIGVIANIGGTMETDTAEKAIVKVIEYMQANEAYPLMQLSGFLPLSTFAMGDGTR
jgi:hypothetical protein